MNTHQQPVNPMDGQETSPSPVGAAKATPSSISACDVDKVTTLSEDLLELVARPQVGLFEDDSVAHRVVLQEIASSFAEEISKFKALRTYHSQQPTIKQRVNVRVAEAKRQMRTRRIRKMKDKMAKAMEQYTSAMEAAGRKGGISTTAEETERASAAKDLDKEFAELAEMRKTVE